MEEWGNIKAMGRKKHFRKQTAWNRYEHKSNPGDKKKNRATISLSKNMLRVKYVLNTINFTMQYNCALGEYNLLNYIVLLLSVKTKKKW